jgi:flagellar M-ring protein FliF
MGSTTTSGGTDSSYTKKQTTRDNGVDTVVEHRETSPGSVNSQHIGVVLDSTAAASTDPNQVRQLISDAVGIDTRRGDTVNVSLMPFDRTADDAAAKELAAAAAAEKHARTVELLRDAGIAFAILAFLLLAWVRGRRRNRAQAAATTYLAEQIRLDSTQRAARPAVQETPALAALERSELTPAERTRDELSALVEKQPEHVAALLRGWLAERD